MTASIELVGILNITPDSFSDGGRFLAPKHARAQAEALMEDGASLIELGADSTRPGSRCVGIESEWTRLAPVIQEIAGTIPFSVDTHHAVIAHRACDHGAILINNVFPGSDEDMPSVIAQYGCRYVVMHSRCIEPHVFSLEVRDHPIVRINTWWKALLPSLLALGVSPGQVILDPGMGAFLSPRAEDSWGLIREFGELASLHPSIMVGTSRKGFLDRDGTREADRDPLSALSALRCAQLLSTDSHLYIRAHNIKMHRSFLSAPLW